MGTPASVISSPAVPWQAPEPRARKKASANIFKDIDLLQIQTLFRTSGDECAEERAHIIYNCAGDRRIAEALGKLRRKKRNKSFNSSSSPKLSSDRIEGLTMQNFNKLCITETAHRGSTSTETSPARTSSPTPDRPSLCPAKKMLGKQRTKTKLRRQQQTPVSTYLHQIKR